MWCIFLAEAFNADRINPGIYFKGLHVNVDVFFFFYIKILTAHLLHKHFIVVYKSVHLLGEKKTASPKPKQTKRIFRSDFKFAFFIHNSLHMNVFPLW